VALRAVIFGLEGILIKGGEGDPKTGLASERRGSIVKGIRELFDFLRMNDIRPIVLSNRDWQIVNRETGARTTIDKRLETLYGTHTLYVAQRGDVPFKPSRESISRVLELQNLSASEVVFVGMSERDFRTALQSKILFMNATWDRQETSYGFVFDSPQAIKRFIELFGLKAHHWFYQIDSPIRYRSLAPFSTYKEDYRVYSEAARNAAKIGTPERRFFLYSLVASLYFTDLIKDIGYIACVPGHEKGYGNAQMDDVLRIVGQTFGARYLPDLVVRHTDAPSQREERNSGRVPIPVTQMNSLRLNKFPLKIGKERYKNPIPLKGNKVLIFDDFTTNGFSFEATRLCLAQAGADALLVSWLKTINRDYTVLRVTRDFDPFEKNVFSEAEIKERALTYRTYVVDSDAPTELAESLKRFRAFEKKKA